MAFEDGFKDIGIIFPVSIRNGRNDANNPEYRPEDIIRDVPCRIRRTDTEIRIYFEKTQSISKGDCVFSVNTGEMYMVESIRGAFGKTELHHMTCCARYSPEKALMEMVKGEQ